jgi:hypothetical protein
MFVVRLLIVLLSVFIFTVVPISVCYAANDSAAVINSLLAEHGEVIRAGAVLAAVIVLIALIVRGKKRKSADSYRILQSVKPPDDYPHLQAGSLVGLRNVKDAGQGWEIPLKTEILIGRSDECQVCLEEISVSLSQCKIYLDEAVMLENLSNTNKTHLNGIPLDNPAAIKPGDEIKCGRVTLIVDSFTASNPDNAEKINRQTRYVNI